MERDAAAEIIPMLVRAAQETADTVAVYRRYAPETQIASYSDAVGKVVAALDDTLRRIVAEHPDLDPGGFSSNLTRRGGRKRRKSSRGER